MWITYILECADESYYTGVTNDLEARITAHNNGNGSKYTRSRLPVKLVWQAEQFSRSTAQMLEYKIKQLTREQKEELIKGNLK